MPASTSYSAALGQLIVKAAKLNSLFNGKDSSGVDADLSILSSKDLFINISSGTGSNLVANDINVTGNLFTNTGTFASSSNAPGLTLTSATGDLTLTPAGVVNISTALNLVNGTLSASSNLTLNPADDLLLEPGSGFVRTTGTIVSSSSNAVLSSVGVPTLIQSGTGQNIALNAAAGQSLTTTSPFVTSDTHVSGTTALVLGAASGNVTISPSAGKIVLTPGGSSVVEVSSDLLLDSHNVVGSNAAGLSVTASSGDLDLTSTTGSVIANSLFKTSQGTIESTATNLALTTAAQGDIQLFPAGSNAHVAIGAIDAGTTTILQVNGGAITATKATTLSTTAGDLTVTSAGNTVFTSPITTTSGAISSVGTDLVLSAATGHAVVIHGNLNVDGDVNHINTTDLLVEDKLISLAHSLTPGALSTVDGAGIVIENADTDVSLKFAYNAGNPNWDFAGGDVFFSKTFTNASSQVRTVQYQLVIDEDSENLVFLKVASNGTTLGSASAASVFTIGP
jgi:hypothetical protein